MNDCMCYESATANGESEFRKQGETQTICEPEAVIEGPYQPRSFNFPSRAFGKAKVTHCSFQSKWFDIYKCLHYNEAQDAAYCYTCKTADEQKKLRTK